MPLTRDTRNPRNIELNDVLGNYSLTLIDSLSTLAILASAPPDDGDTGPKALCDFQDGVGALVQQYGDGRPGPSGEGQRGRGFDMDSKVQVFETVIRGVGGLLSAHLFAVGELPMAGYAPPTPPAHPDERQSPIEWPNGFTYDGQLLRLALDLATRLLPAFYTNTGMPYPRVNLRYGIPFYTNSPLHSYSGGDGEGDDDNGDDGDGAYKDARRSGRRTFVGPPEITETCSAGAGSLVLEFTVLSRLTGDQRFEQLAKRAFWAVWYRRSDIGLIGAGVDAEQGRWIGAYSVIGAGADSFFEYALKTHILLSGHELPNRTANMRPPEHHLLPMWTRDNSGTQTALAWHDPNRIFPLLSEAENAPDSFLEAWHLAHAAIKRHLYSDREHPHYVNVNLWTGSLAAQWIDSLGAYYSGLLTLAGELEEAVETNLLYTAVWAKYAALPERWSIKDRTVEGGLGWWPLRPEFIESVYHLYRATKDPWYLYVGEMVQHDIKRRCWTSCGWAGLQNVLSGERTDRMESFFLGETAKYMYLLFDDRHPLNSLDAAYVFTTEGHPLIIPKRERHGDGDGGASGSTKDRVRGWKAAQRATRTTKPDDGHDQTHSYSGIPGVPEPDTNSAASDGGAVNLYGDGGFTDMCPVPPPLPPLTGSAVAARHDIYHAAKMLDLHLMAPNSEDENRRLAVETGLDRKAFFPWTLPPSLLPHNGTSAKVQQPLEMTLEFSAQPQEMAAHTNLASLGGGGGNGASFNMPLGAASALGRISPNKIRVNNISGLKIIFRLEDDEGERAWRVTRVNGMPLGRDESLVLDRALVSHIADQRFAVVRDPIVVKLHHMHYAVWAGGNETSGEVVVVRGDEHDDEEPGEGDSKGQGDDTMNDNEHDDGGIDAKGDYVEEEEISTLAGAPPPPPTASALTTLVKSLWRQLVARTTLTPEEDSGSRRWRRSSSSSSSSKARSRRINIVLNATGVTPTGLGAAPLPPVDIPVGAAIPAAGPVAADLLPWHRAYAGGDGCDGPLPETAVRDHQVLVLRRGRCSFSEKLANVPSFAASPQRLQLVVVVSDDDDVRVRSSTPKPSSSQSQAGMTFHDNSQDFVRPLLDAAQRTPGGLARWQPLAMVMVGGGEAAYRQIAEARQLGLTRRYTVESQGMRVRNVILDDGDDV